jgi:pimeloyl-ACP methyl ester carboxylesterase
MMPAAATLRVPTADGAKLDVHVTGSGHAVLLVSGLGGTAGFWRPVAAGLAGWRVITLDQRGIGASTRGAAPCTIATLADDCLAVLDRLDVARCVVVGHSTGGCIAMTLAARAPERVAGLGLSGTWLRPNRYMEALFGARAAILDSAPEAYATLGAMLSHPAPWLEAHWEVYEATMRQAPRSAAARTIVGERIEALRGFDGSDLIARLSAPALILGAHDDLVVPFFLQQELHHQLPAAGFAAFETGGHFFPLTQTAPFCDRLRSWIGGLA